MIAFIIKSIINLSVTYAIYKIFLAEENMPVFRRYFLLFGMFLVIIMSSVTIQTDANIPQAISDVIPSHQIERISSPETEIFFSTTKDTSYLQWVLWGIYGFVAAVLLFRFIRNIRQLIQLKRNNPIYTNEDYTVVVVEEDISPYSFFSTIYISSKDYNKGAIRKEILLHELAHIQQKHSIDIVLFELMQIVCWFNPILWLYKKEIRLNHEYLADKQVMNSGIEATMYQKFMLDFTFRNNSSYLASSFNYSFIKNRFIMLTKEKSFAKAATKAAIAIPIIALLVLVMSISQTANATDKNLVQDNWWAPILLAHNMQYRAYNNFGNIVEFAHSNSIEGAVSSSTGGVLVIIRGENDDYMMIEAAETKYNIEDGSLAAKFATVRSYKAGFLHPIPVLEGDRISINTKSMIAGNPFND